LRASASFSAATRTPDRGLRPHGTTSLSPVAKGGHESRAANRFGIVIGVEGGHWVGIRRSTRARCAWTSPPPASSGHPLLPLRKSALKQRHASPSAYNSGHGMVRDRRRDESVTLHRTERRHRGGFLDRMLTRSRRLVILPCHAAGEEMATRCAASRTNQQSSGLNPDGIVVSFPRRYRTQVS
jgi:hypothetical protein